MEGKIPPQVVELEQAVLGSCMVFKQSYIDCSAILRPESFYKDGHRLIWEAIEALFKANQPIDVLTVTNALKTASKLDEAGGLFYVATLPDQSRNSAAIEFHCRLIEEKRILRQQIELAGEILRQAYADDADPFMIEDYITSTTLAISANTSGEVTHIKELMPAVIASAENKGGVTGLSTGIGAVDQVYSGRQNSDLIIKAARPSMGKTSHALTEAKHQAMQGKHVLFFSLEMSNTQLAQRITAMDSGVNLNAIRNGGMTSVDFAFMNESIGRIERSQMWLVDNCYELRQILSVANKRKMAGFCDVIYVDYLQLVNHKANKGNREQEISSISRAFKMMAKNLDVPVIALSQLSRSVETRGGDKRPILSDLRESGSIEQDADVVEFLYRPEYYGVTDIEGYDTATGLAFLCVAKHRNGGLRDVPMRWEADKVRFSEWSNYPEPSNIENLRMPYNEKFEDGDAPF
jgi:replicative DNA helicase